MVDELVGFTRLEKEGIAGFNFGRSILVPNSSGTRNHMIKLPLRTVRMIRALDLSGRDPANFDVERVSLFEVGREWFTSKGFGDLYSGADKLFLW